MRLGRLETDVAVLKTDVGQLKTDVGQVKTDLAELKNSVGSLQEQANRPELAFDRGFNRVDAQFERLVRLIQRSETGDC